MPNQGARTAKAEGDKAHVCPNTSHIHDSSDPDMHVVARRNSRISRTNFTILYMPCPRNNNKHSNPSSRNQHHRPLTTMDIHLHQHHMTRVREDSKENLRVSVNLTRDGSMNVTLGQSRLRALQHRSLRRRLA
jgi:hypothetical protein